jgi:hypothetical protein
MDVLAGFDIVAQFSQRLLQQGMVQSLSQRGLATPNAFVPWGTVPLPPSLLSSLAPAFRHIIDVVEARLELRLVEPYLIAFHWPEEETGLSDDPVVTARPRLDRRVDVGWRLELSVLISRPDRVVAIEPEASRTPPLQPGSRPGRGSVLDSAFAMDGLLATEGRPPPTDGGRWERFVLASGQVVTPAKVEVVVASNVWCFGMQLDFSDTSPRTTSEQEGATEFLASEAGRAVVNLRANGTVRLTPDVAPGGALSAMNVDHFNLAPFWVRDLLLSDQRGNPVLALCAQLGGATGGVARLVRNVLERQDFAYAVSTDVLSPALKTHWKLTAGGLSFVGEVPVDLPVGDDPEETEPGRAQLQVTFSDTLDDVAIMAGTDRRGDPLRLLSRQRVQLLNLWRHNGDRITDLGDLAKPEDQPFALPLYFFDRARPVAVPLNPNFRDLMVMLMGVVAYPLLQPFPVRASSVSGFASSAMETLLIRWSLKSVLDDVHAPISEVVGGPR